MVSGRFISLFLILFSVNAVAGDLKCGPGELRTRFLGKVKVIKSDFCTDKRGTVLISEPFNKENALGKIIPPSESVNPGWIFCDSLKGTTEFVEIHIGKQWFELDRCIFADGTYIDTASLFELGVLPPNP